VVGLFLLDWDLRKRKYKQLIGGGEGMDILDIRLLHKRRDLGQGNSQASLGSRYLEPEVVSSVSVLAPRLFIHYPKIVVR